MDLSSFKSVVEYQIQCRSLKQFFTPNINIINAVKEYNIIRAKAAKNIASAINNNVLIEALRKSEKIVQIDTSPQLIKCCISKTNLNVSHGITLMIYIKEKTEIFCIHKRFLSYVNRYYNIVHFDSEIFKLFKSWVLKKYTSTDFINKQHVDDILYKFISYNNSSKINLLYIKFNAICDS